MTTEEILLQTVASLTRTNEEQGRRLSEQSGMIAEQSNQIAELTAELKRMSAQIAWFLRQMFGRRSEKSISIDTQPGLFDAAELDALHGSCVAPDAEKTGRRRKSHTRAGKAAKALPETVRHGKTCRCLRQGP